MKVRSLEQNIIIDLFDTTVQTFAIGYMLMPTSRYTDIIGSAQYCASDCMSSGTQNFFF